MRAKVKIYNSNAEVYVDDNAFPIDGGYENLTQQDIEEFIKTDVANICDKLSIKPEDIENLDELKTKLEVFYDKYRE